MDLLMLDRDALTEMVGKNLTQFCLYVDVFSPEQLFDLIASITSAHSLREFKV